jgi:dTDP-4-amino-4,6-dideoxygalactose transaminase
MSNAGRGLSRWSALSNSNASVNLLERAIGDRLFGGQGVCLAVANAKIGLMLAMRHAAESVGRPGGYAMMPSFAGAAAAQAALLAGLTPLLVDIDRDTWTASPQAEAAMLARYGAEIAVAVPSAIFAHGLDVDRYADMAATHGIGIVVNSGPSLAAQGWLGHGFTPGSSMTGVLTLPAATPGAPADGAIIYCADAARLTTLRRMTEEAAVAAENAAIPGRHVRMAEVTAHAALGRLDDAADAAGHRAVLAGRYRARLTDVTFQLPTGPFRANVTKPVLLPADLAARRGEIVSTLGLCGIAGDAAWSLHAADLPGLRADCEIGPLDVTAEIAGRVVTLPLHGGMTEADVDHVAETMNETLAALRARRRRRFADAIVAAAPVGAGA